MKISLNSSNVNFGKTPLLKCSVKEKETQNRANATLYELDYKSASDIDEVRYSKNARSIYQDIIRANKDSKSPFHFYFLKNDKTGEVMACAETYHCYRKSGDKTEGTSTVIEELSENSKYINASEPVVSYFAKQALERYDSTVTTAFRTEEFSLKNSKFEKTKADNWVLPEKRFGVLIDQAEKRYQTEFIG